MCKVCRQLHGLEYERLHKHVVRKRSILEFFEWHKCIICHEHIDFGFDICDQCREKRKLISKVLIEEFKKSVERKQ